MSYPTILLSCLYLCLSVNPALVSRQKNSVLTLWAPASAAWLIVVSMSVSVSPIMYGLSLNVVVIPAWLIFFIAAKRCFGVGVPCSICLAAVFFAGFEVVFEFCFYFWRC